MPNILLTIVCPVYNCAKYAEELVGALISNANDPRIEWIFVHDCSPDNSEAAIKEGLAAREGGLSSAVTHITHQQNQGISVARNRGISAARGEYVAFLDSDDLPLPGYASRVLEVLTEQAPVMLEVGFQEFRHVEELPRAAAHREACQVQRYSAGRHFDLLFRNHFFVWSRIVRRSLLDRVRFAESRKAYEDIPFALMLFCEAGEVTYLKTPLVGYRKHLGSITSIRDQRFFDQYAQLTEAVRYYRSHPDVVRLPRFEWQLQAKLCVILLKGARINTASERRAFYQAVTADLRESANPLPRVVNNFTRLLARLLSVSTEVFQRAA